MSNADYQGLCLDGSKECTRIHEFVYNDLDDIAKMELAHSAFTLMSFIGTVGPMFVVNAWIPVESARYETSIKQNGF